jgi:hypothetical protein
MWLKQSTAVDIPLGPFVDSTDGVTAETALTISQADVRLKKNAGAWAQKNQASSATHEENGWYEVSLDTTDTNTLGILKVAVNESGALPVWKEYLVLPANVYDSLLSTDLLQVDLREWVGVAPAALTSTLVQTQANQLGAQAKTDVNTEVVDCLVTDTYAEPSGVVAATAGIKDMLNWLKTLARNKITQTSTTQTLRNDGDSGTISTATTTDDGTTFTRAKFV